MPALRRTSLLAGLAAATALVPATAEAADLSALDRVDFVSAGPSLSGDRVVYGAGSSPGATFTLLQTRLGTTVPETLFTANARSRRELLSGGATAASPTRTGFIFDRIDEDSETPSSQQAFGGAPTGPFAATAGSDDGRSLAGAIDLSGDAQLTIERTSARVDAVVRDLAAGATIVRTYENVTGAAIAGDLVAHGTKTAADTVRVTVSDWRTGADLYAVDVPVTPPYGFGFGLDVQADGTIAVRAANPASTGQKPKVDLAWASVAEPSLHQVAKDVGTQITKIDGGTILFERARDAKRRELAVSDLAGNTRAASFPVGYVSGADLDAGKVAFATDTCVYGGDLPASAPAFAPAGTCPQTALGFSTAATKTRGKIAVKVTCLMASSRGCAGSIALQTPKAKGRKTATIGLRGITMPAGKTTTYHVRLSAKGMKTLRGRVGRKRRTAIIDVVVRAEDDAGLTSSNRRDALVRLR